MRSLSSLVSFVALAMFFLVACGTGAAQAQQTVQIVADPNSPLMGGTLVRVNFSGYTANSYCVIEFIDVATSMTVQQYNAAGRAGYAKFKVGLDIPAGTQITVSAKALLSTGGYGLFSTNNTVYTVEQPLVKRSTVDQRGYYSGYYPDEYDIVYIDNIGNPPVLAPHALVLAFFEGVEIYDYVLVRIVADNGMMLAVGANGWAGYQQFMKVGMPDSITAFIEVVVFSPVTSEPIFTFSGMDSFALEADPEYHARSIPAPSVRQLLEGSVNTGKIGEPTAFMMPQEIRNNPELEAMYLRRVYELNRPLL